MILTDLVVYYGKRKKTLYTWLYVFNDHLYVKYFRKGFTSKKVIGLLRA